MVYSKYTKGINKKKEGELAENLVLTLLMNMKKNKFLRNVLLLAGICTILSGCNDVDVINNKKEEEVSITNTQNINENSSNVAYKAEETTLSLTQPATTEPVTTQPIETEPETTEAVVTEPVSTEPVLTEEVKSEKVEEEKNEKTSEYHYVDSAQDGVSGYYDSDAAYQVFVEVNKIRAEYGLHELFWDDTLASSAETRAKEASACWSHYRPNGTKYTTVCPTRLEGENLAKHYFNTDDVINAWMNSSGHRENLLREQFVGVGIACYKTDDGGCFWAQSFTTLY